MKYSNRLMGRKTPFIPVTGSDAGLIEKWLMAASDVDLSDSAESIGVWDREASNAATLDSDAEYHKNNAEDPATDTINFADAATLIRDFNRGVTHNTSLSDFAHAALDGYHPPGGGSGDTYLDRHTVTANETIAVGQPVYVTGNNTVNLADADSINTSHVLGLAETAGTANGTMNVLSSGTVNQADWTSVIGSATLTPGAVYYLSTTAGQLTTTPPSGSGDAVVSCGIAVTNTKLDIEINEIAVL